MCKYYLTLLLLRYISHNKDDSKLRNNIFRILYKYRGTSFQNRFRYSFHYNFHSLYTLHNWISQNSYKKDNHQLIHLAYIHYCIYHIGLFFLFLLRYSLRDNLFHNDILSILFLHNYKACKCLFLLRCILLDIQIHTL